MKYALLLIIPVTLRAMDDIEKGFIAPESYQNRPLILDTVKDKAKEETVAIHRPRADTSNESIGKALLTLYFGDGDEDICSQLLPCLVKKIEEKKNARSSSYRLLRASMEGVIKDREEGKEHRNNPQLDETLKELILESMKESYKEKELESHEKIEELKTSRIICAASLSACTAVIGAVLSATVTILLSEKGKCPM